MPIYRVEQYELLVHTLQVEGIDEADAISKVLQGEGDSIEWECAGTADAYGMTLLENPDLAIRLREIGVIDSGTTIIPSIRSVEEIELTD